MRVDLSVLLIACLAACSLELPADTSGGTTQAPDTATTPTSPTTTTTTTTTPTTSTPPTDSATGTDSGTTGTTSAPDTALADTSCPISTDDSGNHVALPRPNITRLEISRGRKGHTGMGLLLGLVLGLSAVALKDAGCGQDCEKPSTGFVVGAVAGGALVGAGIGTMIRSERWESLPWAVGPARRTAVPISGPGLKVTLRF